MKRYTVVLAVVVVWFIFATLVSVFANDLAWEDIGRENLNLRTVLVNPDNPQVIYIGSSNAVLKSEDGGVSWRNILSVRSQNRSVNFLLFDPQDKNSLYVATGNGLFLSTNQGRDWRRIFQGKNYLENECTALAVLPDGIYLGTKAGLFITKDKGRSWHKGTAKLSNSRILAIAYNLREPNYIYAACTDGVFKSRDKGDSWERIFVASSAEDNGQEEEGLEDTYEEGRSFQLRYITCDPDDLDSLYLATTKGLYKSRDRGKTWEPVSNYGLLNQDITFLLISHKSRLYAATQSGIFEYQAERWRELSFGLITDEIRFLAQDSRNNLYAACDKGLFKANLTYFSDDRQDTAISLYFENEPRINEVQQAAIKYAEVEPEKIKQWRRKAQIKAILPKLTVGLDNSQNTNYEIYTSATTRYVYEGPEDNSSGWDVALSWELGDLIWSEAQTSIDVRSRLMVQLRDDILDEVTKLYFERIRVKMEINNLTIEDSKKRFEKELKLQELAASLDALTGGYFSSHLPD